MNGSIIIDTNSLIYALKNRIDIRSQLLLFPEISAIYVTDCTVLELQGLSNRVPFASGALKLAEGFPAIHGSGKGDDCILQAAVTTGSAILTNDRLLLDRARSLGLRTFSIHGGRRIGVSL
ncbi:MAG: hypothetical protein M1431_05175 [Candidatus Thermoplasmatota archaeon]|nr:hypothetical protein [Candidatus Thermoplasmatota archaeon]